MRPLSDVGRRFTVLATSCLYGMVLLWWCHAPSGVRQLVRPPLWLCRMAPRAACQPPASPTSRTKNVFAAVPRVEVVLLRLARLGRVSPPILSPVVPGLAMAPRAGGLPRRPCEGAPHHQAAAQ